MTLRDRYHFVCACVDCGYEMRFTGDSVSFQLGDPVPSKLEVDGRPELTRSIYKRAVLLWVPDVCPECRNLKAAQQ